MIMQYFRDSEELLSLFEIDPKKPGAQDFLCLCDMYAIMCRFEQYRVTVADLAAVLMRQRKLSPLVFWSRMRRAVRPLIEADAETLRALGIPCGYRADDHTRTCPELAAEIGETVGHGFEIDADAAQVAADIAAACRKAK